MKNACIATILYFILIPLAVSAQSQGPGNLRALAFSEGFRFEATGLKYRPGAEAYEKVIISGKQHAVELDGIEMEEVDDLLMLRVDQAHVAHMSADGGAFSLEGVEISLPVDAVERLMEPSEKPGLCRYLDQVISAKVETMQLALGLYAGFHNSRFKVEGLDVIPGPDKRCLDKSFTARKVSGTRRSGYTWAASDVLAHLDLPESESAAKSGGAISGVSAAVGRVTFQFPDAVQYLILNDAGFDFKVASSDLSPAFLSFRSDLLMAPRWRETSILMDLWNMLSLLKGRAHLEVREAQILAANIVPTYLTANFRNAGLSSVPARVEIDFEADRGFFALDADSSFAGLADITVQSTALALLYNREILTYADQGRITLADAPPDVGVLNLDATWQSKGFGARFSDLLGLPPGSWFAIFSEQEEIQFSESFTTAFTRYSAIAARFFRNAKSGRQLSISAKTPDKPRLGQILKEIKWGPGAVLHIFPVSYE